MLNIALADPNLAPQIIRQSGQDNAAMLAGGINNGIGNLLKGISEGLERSKKEGQLAQALRKTRAA